MTEKDRLPDIQETCSRERQQRLKRLLRTQEVLKAPVTQVLDGGLCVNVEEARVFIPASLVSDTYEKDLSQISGSGN